MALQITDDETCQQAAELAKLTGESTTQAIAAAVRERLQREQGMRGRPTRKEKASIEELTAIADRAAKHLRERDKQAFLDDVHAITARIAKLAKENPGKGLTDDDLYDEHGLPK